MKKHICLFDMDGTLTPARKNIEFSVVKKIKELTRHMTVGIVTGSDYDYILQQCGPMFEINGVDPTKLELFPCNGTKHYTWSDKTMKYELVHEADMRKEINQEKYSKILQGLMSYQILISIRHRLPYTGTFFQYRGSMLNWCPIGRIANDEERKAWVTADAESEIRDHWIQQLKKDFERDSIPVTVALGGSTSFDIYPEGWDKTYVMNHLSGFKKIYFIGDRCEEGGNDKALYDLLQITETSYKTDSPSNTVNIINQIIKEDVLTNE